MKHAAGFTLIELLVVILIVTVLASISIPLFADYSKKTKAADTWEELEHISVLQEQIYNDYRSYAVTASRLQSYGAKVGYVIGTPNAAKYFYILIGNDAIWTATAYLCFAGETDCGPSKHDYAFTVNQAGFKTTTPKNGATAPGWAL